MLNLLGFPLVWVVSAILLREAIEITWLCVSGIYVVLALTLTMKGVNGDQPPTEPWQTLRRICSWLFRIWMGSFLLQLYGFLFMLIFYRRQLFAR
ncbi:MAG TPA: hypothetical protein VFD58_18770 [Blastocatellia bacterium]|nr:hypothetical protein [Blastocatellia bacterium]